MFNPLRMFIIIITIYMVSACDSSDEVTDNSVIASPVANPISNNNNEIEPANDIDGDGISGSIPESRNWIIGTIYKISEDETSSFWAVGSPGGRWGQVVMYIGDEWYIPSDELVIQLGLGNRLAAAGYDSNPSQLELADFIVSPTVSPAEYFSGSFNGEDNHVQEVITFDDTKQCVELESSTMTSISLRNYCGYDVSVAFCYNRPGLPRRGISFILNSVPVDTLQYECGVNPSDLSELGIDGLSGINEATRFMTIGAFRVGFSGLGFTNDSASRFSPEVEVDQLEICSDDNNYALRGRSPEDTCDIYMTVCDNSIGSNPDTIPVILARGGSGQHSCYNIDLPRIEQ